MDGGGPFGQQILKGFFGADNLRDYQHASRTFLTNSYELKPRFKFLFHVNFVLNVDQIPALRTAQIFGETQLSSLSLSVKTVDLPKYTFNTETLNQYNRKRVVQTKINYDPVTITFHDDSGDNIREMWYQYYSYYYKDPAQQFNTTPNTNGSIGQIQNYQPGFGYQPRDIYAQNRVGNVNDWGYIGESFNDGGSGGYAGTGKPPFFRYIEVFGFDQHKYARYVLMNPLITNFAHDQYSYAEGGGTMQNSMTVAYETVKYFHGTLGKPDRNVAWPDPAHYDTTLSPISRPGTTATVFGQGGLLDTGQGILEDLQSNSVAGWIGAIQKAGTAYNTFKGKNLQSVVQAEAVSLGKKVIQQDLPGATRAVINKADGWIFPKQNSTTTVQTQTNAGQQP